MAARLSSLDSPRDSRMGRWVRHQVEAVTDHAARDVRELADAQARLLCIVDGIAAEVNSVRAQTHVQAQIDAQNQIESRKLQELMAGLRPRFEMLEGEMAHLRLKQSQHEFPQPSSIEGLAAVVMRLTRLESDSAARAKRDSSTTEWHAEIVARLFKLEAELASKHHALCDNLESIKQLASKHDALSSNLAGIKHGLAQEFENLKQSTPSHTRDVAELRQHLHGGLDGSGGLCQRVASLEQGWGDGKAKLEEQRQQAMHLEAWQNRLCEGVSGWQQQLATDLRGELRTMMQSLAAAIKALDERLRQLDGHQSLEVDASLVSHMQPASLADTVKSPRDVAVRQNGAARAAPGGLALPAAFVSAADELASSMSGVITATTLCSPRACGTARGGVPKEPLPFPQGSGSRAPLCRGLFNEGDTAAPIPQAYALAAPVASEHFILGASAARLFEVTSAARVSALRSPRTPERISSTPSYPRLSSSPMSCYLAAEQTLAAESISDQGRP